MVVPIHPHRFGAGATVRETALAGAAFRRILQQHGIDFTAPWRSLAEAARAAEVPPPELLAALNAAEVPVNARRTDWERRGSRELAIFLRRRHHAPLAEEMRFLDALFRRALVRNRTARARRERLYEAFSTLAAPLAAHREREEIRLYPRLAAGDSGWPLVREIAALAEDHRRFRRETRRLRLLGSDLAEGRSDPALALLAGELAAFADALEEHLFWEDCLLFPRAARIARIALP